MDEERMDTRTMLSKGQPVRCDTAFEMASLIRTIVDIQH